MDWSYIAGFFDGEGGVYSFIRCNVRGTVKVYYALAITNTIENVLQQMCVFTKLGKVKPRKYRKPRQGAFTSNSPNWKPVYDWQIRTRKGQLDFAEKTLPHLVIKRDKMQQMLEYLKNTEGDFRSPISISVQQLTDLYVNQKRTVRSIAMMLKTSQTPILRRLRMYNIPTRKKGWKVLNRRPRKPKINCKNVNPQRIVPNA